MPSAHDFDHRLFFAAPPWPDAGETLVLDPREARHATRARRLSVGDRLQLVDGDGHRATGAIAALEGARVTVRLEAIAAEALAPPVDLAVPYLSAPARLDWAIEKGTELGVRRFDVFTPARGVKRAGPRGETRVARWRQLARAAMKQAGRSWWPRVEFWPGIADLMEQRKDAGLWVRGEPHGRPPVAVFGPLAPETPLQLVVGGEGGWSPEEERLLARCGARPCRLGPYRLRAETAAIALAAAAAVRGAAGGREAEDRTGGEES